MRYLSNALLTISGILLIIAYKAEQYSVGLVIMALLIGVAAYVTNTVGKDNQVKEEKKRKSAASGKLESEK